MSAAIPVIRPTSCPTAAELADKSKRWAIVRSSSGRAYVGRILDEGDNLGAVRLGDPFDYFSKREVSGTAEQPRIAMARQLFPVEHFDVDEILVHAADVIAMHRLSPRAVDKMREELIPAWDGRDHLRKHGGRLELAGAGTKIEAP